jgi:hypothetical protein
VSRSGFLESIEEQVRQACQRGGGWPFQVRLGQGGYPGKVEVVIQPGNADDFEVDWHHGDPTRFPQRIRAAATWLRDHGHFGAFHISHADGALTIAKRETD